MVKQGYLLNSLIINFVLPIQFWHKQSQFIFSFKQILTFFKVVFDLNIFMNIYSNAYQLLNIYLLQYQLKMMLKNYLKRIVQTLPQHSFVNHTSKKISHRSVYQFSSLENNHSKINDISQSKKRVSLQQAIIARYIMRFFNKLSLYLHQLQATSIREKMLNISFLKQFIVNQINQKRLIGIGKGQKLNLVNQQWLDKKLSDQNFQIVLSAFKMNQGYKCNKIIWNQNRMSLATNFQQFIVLNPLFLYQQYFTLLQSPDNSIMSGQKGIGKSFSFISYSYLSSFIHLIPFELQEKQREIIKELYPFQKFENITKMIYINASHKFKLGQYYKQIIHQLQGIYQLEDIKAQNIFQVNKQNQIILDISDLLNFLEKLSKKIQGKKISFILVIDEANKILRLIRELLKKIKSQRVQILLSSKQYEPSKYRQSYEYQELKKYDRIIEVFSKYFEKIMFHSSQEYEIKLFEQFSEKQLQDFYLFNFITKDRKFVFKKIEYSKLKRIPVFHNQLHTIFWFQIQRVLSQSLLSQQNIKILKTQFDNSFFKQKVKWKNEVRFLHIRQYLTTERKIQLIFSCQQMLKTKVLQNRSLLIMNYFRALKMSIQKQRFKNLIMENIFLNYINKATSFQHSVKRHFIILNIFSEIQKTVKRIQAKQITEEDQFIYFNNEVPQIEKSLLCETISFGYYNQNTNAITFELTPSNLLKVFQKATFNLQYRSTIKYLVNSLWLQQQNFNLFFGKMFDNLSYLVFKVGKLSIQITDAFEYQKLIFAIETTLQFPALRQLSGKPCFEYFKDLISVSSSTTDKYFGGYPTSNSSFESTSELFDNILFKKVVKGQDSFHQMIAFDWTMGAVSSKNTDEFSQKIKRFFEKVSLKVPIKLTIYIVAPKFQAEFYLKKIGNSSSFQYRPMQMLCTDNIKHEYTIKLAYFDENLPFTSVNSKQLHYNIGMLKQIYLRNLKQHKRKQSNKKAK